MSVTPEILLQRVEDDRKKPLMDRGIIEREWLSFVGWLDNSYTKRDAHGKDLGKPLAPTTVKSYAGIIKTFYAFYGFPMSKRAALPKKIASSKGKVENVAIRYRPEQVRKLISVMDNNEHKTVCLIQFQGGLDVSTVYNLKWKNVRDQLSRKDSPILLTLQRGKTGKIFKTVIGEDAIKSLRNYVNELNFVKYQCTECGVTWKDQRKTCPYCKIQSVKEKQEKLKANDYLFARSRKNRARVFRDYQLAMRRYVVLAEILTPEQLEDSDISKGRPHALRAGFSSILKGKGCDRELVEYMLGHEIPYAEAYFKMSDKEIIDTYGQYEKYLSLDYREDFDKLEARVDAKIKRLTNQNEAYESRIMELKNEIEKLKELERNRINALAKEEPDIPEDMKRKLIKLIESEMSKK